MPSSFNMGLLPLEFSDCILDSPYFRENLRAHEKELDRTSSDIKGIIRDIQDVLEASKLLTKAKRTLAKSLKNFRFDCLGATLTDDEIIISNSLKEFGLFLGLIEDEMDRMLEKSYEKFIVPLTKFRKEQIGSVKKTKKDFDKCTQKFCAAQDRYAHASSKKEEYLHEAAENLRLESRNLQSSSLEYVYIMQVVQERKKFEFVEALLCFVSAWSVYYRHGSSVGDKFHDYIGDLASRIQKSRENYSITIERYDDFKRTVGNKLDPGVVNKMYTRQGYLYSMSKKPKLGLTAWTKLYCQYQAHTKILTMITYTQLNGKISSTDSIKVIGCSCKEGAQEKFKFVVIGEDCSDPGHRICYTLQALTDLERKLWVEALGGTWPALNTLQRIKADSVEDNLNSSAFNFLKDCLSELERRGLKDQGLYRVGGVVSKVKSLLNAGLDPVFGQERLNLEDSKMWESKTIASAVKQYFRDLNKPLMTHTLYHRFLEAVKNDREEERISKIKSIVHQLPNPNKTILKILIRHLNSVAASSRDNLMTGSNLGVCFGPTLLRPKEETVACIMDTKFCNEVVEILIDNYETIFENEETPFQRKISVPARTVRGNSVPKRTQSFSGVSTNSLPNIEELRISKRKEEATVYEEEALRDTDLMASLEMMTSLAADLPSRTKSPKSASIDSYIGEEDEEGEETSPDVNHRRFGEGDLSSVNSNSSSITSKYDNAMVRHFEDSDSSEDSGRAYENVSYRPIVIRSTSLMNADRSPSIPPRKMSSPGLSTIRKLLNAGQTTDV